MVGQGSVNHNSRKFHAKNTDPERSHLNITYCQENIKAVYHELFDEALERYNAKQTRADRRIEDYYEKIRSGKQEKPFHEIILQVGNRDDMSADSEEGQLAAAVLDEYMKGFQERNPQLRVFSAHLHMDEAMADPRYLHTLTMTELFQTAYMSRPPVAEGLLYAGAYILAGAPKIGKSFLVAQIAYHVSTGQDLWGYKVHQGTVLYLALEDDFQRIQSRMFMMYGVNDTPNLHFATTAGKIGNGLDEQLENFMQEYPDTKLIIIDTMQKIREVSGEAYSYASDYEIIGRIKQFADQHGICVLTVHHTRKQQADDSFETISGTTGLLGCADGSLLMQKKKRTELDATIKVVGRDQPDQILYLKKDPQTQIWNLDRMENELYKEPPDLVLEAIAKLVKEPWSGSPTELVSFLQIDMLPNTLTKHLNVNSGRLLLEYNIQYTNSRIHAGRRIKLTPVSEKA